MHLLYTNNQTPCRFIKERLIIGTIKCSKTLPEPQVTSNFINFAFTPHSFGKLATIFWPRNLARINELALNFEGPDWMTSELFYIIYDRRNTIIIVSSIRFESFDRDRFSFCTLDQNTLPSIRLRLLYYSIVARSRETIVR